MKVMCVSCSDVWLLAVLLFGGTFPQVGDECTVISTKRCKCGQHDVYFLEEFHLHCGFDPACFATLPEATAEEMEEEVREGILV